MEALRPAGSRNALILGGSKGLGLGVAKALANRGVNVGIVGRDTAALRNAEEQLTGLAGLARGFDCDLFERSSVASMLSEVDRRLGAVDILLLNSGGPPPLAAASFDEGIWRRQIDAMLLHQMMIATHVLPRMREKKFGRIVIVSSTSLREPIAHLTASNSLRAALAGWAKTLATEVAGDGVTVNLVLPGRFATARTLQFDQMDAADRGVSAQVIAAESQSEIPLGRYGTPEEFGAVVSFLASDEASYVTGVALPIDGGLSRSFL